LELPVFAGEQKRLDMLFELLQRVPS
jgi:hypothetical protein